MNCVALITCIFGELVANNAIFVSASITVMEVGKSEISLLWKRDKEDMEKHSGYEWNFAKCNGLHDTLTQSYHDPGNEYDEYITNQDIE